MRWLVTGSSGYIGQHVVKDLISRNFYVIGLDLKKPYGANYLTNNFSHRTGNICDSFFMEEILKKHAVTGVINLAALKSVQESILKPKLYNQVNSSGVKSLLSVSKSAGVKYFIQSSTAAVYGSSSCGFVDEHSPTIPISPYGETKLEAEHLLADAVNRGDLRGTALRYFNVLGASNSTMKDKSTANIIPKVLSALEKGESPKIFGDDYPTPDGTCVRDYVHVEDVARAHVLVAEALRAKNLPPAINIGTGHGYSVREVIQEILEQKGSILRPKVEPRRQGDPPILVAKVELAEETLGFKAEKDLTEMISSSI